MKKVEDERLKGQLLKNFKTAFLIENSFILLVLIYESFKNVWGTVNAQNPLWASFMLGVVTLSILSQRVTAAIEDKPKISKKRLTVYFVLEFLVFSLLFMLVIPKNIWIAIICGLTVTFITSGVLLYNNHYRD
ncbi:hypothetical protein [Liquorilactobacillus satsumensis]|uniref:hypothetical protein n=1 Tax=Liquorilactobacillus satsumensis TaxID=259059 RepID=UPI0039E8FB78